MSRILILDFDFFFQWIIQTSKQVSFLLQSCSIYQNMKIILFCSRCNIYNTQTHSQYTVYNFFYNFIVFDTKQNTTLSRYSTIN